MVVVGGLVYSLVFAKNTSASRYFAGVLTKFSAHGGILGKDEGVQGVSFSRYDVYGTSAGG